MAVYVYYNRYDQSKEIIKKINADSMEDAIKYFSTIKNLSPKKFSQLFIVEQI
jgi:hypothetical protein